MTIINLPYSFVQFSYMSQTDYILPVFWESDVWFSFIVRGIDPTEADDILGATGTEMQLLLLTGNDNTSGTVASNTLRNYATDDGLIFRKYRVTPTDVLFVWQHDLKKVVYNDPLISCKECFQLGLLFRGSSFVSNIFKKVCNEKDTALLQYYSLDNSFQFYYCDTDYFQNKIRIPAIMERPQIVTDQSIYVLSDGSRRVTKSVKSKEYTLLVDFASLALHECTDMALSHDVVHIQTMQYTGNIVGSGNYSIDWEGAINRWEAQGEVKLIVSPYSAKNSNCNSCGNNVAPPTGRIYEDVYEDVYE